jgi:hypothetical protein
MKNRITIGVSLAENNHSAARFLSIEEKRQVLYAVLLRYATEAEPLRDSAMERVVQAALLGSTEEKPYRIGDILKNLSFSSDGPKFRVQTIQQTLDKLIEQGKVRHKRFKTHHTYFLEQEGVDALSKAIEAATRLFDTALRRLLRDSDHLVNFKVGSEVSRNFICECFARFGKEIAKTVTGRMSHDELLRTADITAAFSAASEGKQLNKEALEYIEARCYYFLKSTNPDDEKLKFYLTQGYYFTQLLGLEEGHFNPIAEQAFVDSVFYLDTNVIIPAIVTSDENTQLFEEMARMARRLGIRLRVTRATINEARRSAADHIQVIKDIVDKVPEELAFRTQNEFIRGYIEAREKNPAIFPETFMEPFDRLTEILKDRWGISLDDRIEDELIGQGDFSYFSEMIKGTTGKPRSVIRHDLSHYLLVLEERKTNPKTWFLTRDGSLVQAGVKLSEDQQPFCFSLIGFLQSISPYLTTDEEPSFVDAFSNLVVEQILPMDAMFDTQDLMVLAEMHEDIQHTPPERVIEAYEYIKRSVLHGNPWTQADIPKVTLELRKFFTSSLEEQRRTLENENLRLRTERERERQAVLAEKNLRLAAEATADQWESNFNTLKAELENLREADSQKAERIQSLRIEHTNDINDIRVQHRIEQQKARRGRMLLGFICGVLIWLSNDVLVAGLTNKWAALSTHQTFLQAAFGLFGLSVFTIPALGFILHTSWREELKWACLITILTVAFAFSRILDNPIGAAWSTYIQIATLIAMLIIYVFVSKQVGD